MRENNIDFSLSPIDVGIIGITGKVGSVLAKMVRGDPKFQLKGGTSRVSRDSDFTELAHASDVFIDFSLPESTMKALEAAREAGIPFVTGTTGISAEYLSKIEESSKIIPILHSPNFSIAIHLMSSLLEKCSRVLSDDYDVDIIDRHHKNKKDAPSGTSLFLAKNLKPNMKSEVEMLSIRGGNVPAEMICEFIGQNDMLSISHRAFGREVFAKGALDCARWIVNQKEPGMYSMEDYIEDLVRLN